MPSVGSFSNANVCTSSANLPVSNTQHSQDGTSTPASSSPPLQQAAELLWPTLALLCWTICSSGLILLNKELMVTDGFKFPMALTAAGQLTSYVGGGHPPLPICTLFTFCILSNPSDHLQLNLCVQQVHCHV